MILCLYGSTCSGKTTVARALASKLNFPLRSCGEEVRRVAGELDIALADVPEYGHRQIDRDTVAWAHEHRPCVIEGRFLDTVFASAAAPATLVRLVASDESRLVRGRTRNPAFTSDDLGRADAEDAKHRARIYNALEEVVPWQTVDTSDLSVDECVRRIVTMLKDARLLSRRV
jgi:cytidylate kinase